MTAPPSDAARAMPLLWRSSASGGDPPAATAGRPPGRTSAPAALGVDAVVGAAIALADERGLPGVSMRAVGERLGCTAMALYTHVPTKAVLVDLMLDAVHAELPLSHPGATWRERVEAWADATWTFYLRHPWVLQVSPARPVLGPHQYAQLEGLLAAVEESGLPPRDLRRLASALAQLVGGVAQTVAETRQAESLTGVAEDAWWYERSALLEQVATDFGTRFPTVTRLADQGAFTLDDESVPYLEQEATETFRTGLALLLDGVASRVARAAS
ncbi:TetR/AcrR family transcriptional regulator [Cellulomonas sp. NPDC055163]